MLPPNGDVPTRRSGSRGISWNNQLYIFGGYFKKNDEYYSDLYVYDLEGKAWRLMPEEGTRPPPRIDHSASLYNSKLYIFGGFDGNLRYADFYQYDLKTFVWTKVVGEGELPPNRFGHTTVVYDDSLFCFGGWNGHYTMDDIFQYSFRTNIWYEIKRVKGEKPLSRYRHSAVLCNNKMYIFGGVDTHQQRFDDMFSFDIDKRFWVREAVSGTVPKARTFHRAVSFGNIMYLLGGFDGSRLNDMHNIALPLSLYEEDSLRIQSRPPTSGSVYSHTDRSEFEEELKGSEELDSRKKLVLLQ